MAIQFYNGKVLFGDSAGLNTDKVAMDPACCCSTEACWQLRPCDDVTVPTNTCNGCSTAIPPDLPDTMYVKLEGLTGDMSGYNNVYPVTFVTGCTWEGSPGGGASLTLSWGFVKWDVQIALSPSCYVDFGGPNTPCDARGGYTKSGCGDGGCSVPMCTANPTATVSHVNPVTPVLGPNDIIVTDNLTTQFAADTIIKYDGVCYVIMGQTACPGSEITMGTWEEFVDCATCEAGCWLLRRCDKLPTDCATCTPRLADTYKVVLDGMYDPADNGTYYLDYFPPPDEFSNPCAWTNGLGLWLEYITDKWYVYGGFIENFGQTTDKPCNPEGSDYDPDLPTGATCTVSRSTPQAANPALGDIIANNDLTAQHASGEVLKYLGICYEILGPIACDGSEITLPTPLDTYVSCEDCETGTAWLHCTSGSVGGVSWTKDTFAVRSTGLDNTHDFLWICLDKGDGNRWYPVYAGESANPAAPTEPAYLQQCGIVPTSCDDLTGWPVTDFFDGAGCSSDSSYGDNFDARYSEIQSGVGTRITIDDANDQLVVDTGSLASPSEVALRTGMATFNDDFEYIAEVQDPDDATAQPIHWEFIMQRQALSTQFIVIGVSRTAGNDAIYYVKAGVVNFALVTYPPAGTPFRLKLSRSGSTVTYSYDMNDGAGWVDFDTYSWPNAVVMNEMRGHGKIKVNYVTFTKGAGDPVLCIPTRRTCPYA